MISEKMKELLVSLKGLDVEKTKKFLKTEHWNSWKDNEILDYRNGICNLGDKLVETLKNMGENEFVYIEKYTTEKYKGEKHFILPFIGRIESIQEVFKKYIPYDALFKHYARETPDLRELARKYTTGEVAYPNTDGNLIYFVRLIGGNNMGRDLDEPQVQIYSFNLDEEILEVIDHPLTAALRCFCGGGDFKTCTVDELMENADQFIRENINPDPVFGPDEVSRW